MALSRVNWYEMTDVSGHQTLMMRTQMLPEKSVIFNQLTRLRDREHFINI
jgi:hypothetical protein